MSGFATLVGLWLLVSGGSGALAWMQANDGTVLAMMAVPILGGGLWYFTAGKKIIARQQAAARAAASAPAPAASAPVVASPPEPTLKRCPMCAESVQAEARICRFCRHDFGVPGS
jgi:hypothetical protein